jgi:hypothetical protein
VNFKKSHPLCANLSHLGILLSTDFGPAEGVFSTLMLLASITGGKGRSTACESISGARGAGTYESSGVLLLGVRLMKQQVYGLISHHQIVTIR